MSAETPKHEIRKVLDALDIRYLSQVGKGRFALPIGNDDRHGNNHSLYKHA